MARSSVGDPGHFAGRERWIPSRVRVRVDHVTQVARAMAKHYKNQVGPWAAYLTVLRDRSR